MSATYRHVPSSELRPGDLVLDHGMRLRIVDELEQYPGANGTVYATTAHVENVDEVLERGLIPRSFLSDDSPQAPRPFPTWRIQGNDLASWTVEVEPISDAQHAADLARATGARRVTVRQERRDESGQLVTESSVTYAPDELDEGELCGWFAACTNLATVLIAHPILGTVPTCDRCAARVERLSR